MPVKGRIDSQSLNLCKAIPDMEFDKNKANSYFLSSRHEYSRIAIPGKLDGCLLKGKYVMFVPSNAFEDAPNVFWIVGLKWCNLDLCCFIVLQDFSPTAKWRRGHALLGSFDKRILSF